ncbi:MAG: cation:proton antiporter [Opitutales bacterium]|nr:cation:proton antiporter [Opitutales bacterium]
MITITLLLAAAALATGLARFLHLPSIPLFLLAGLGLQLGLDFANQEISETFLQSILELGLAVLVFGAGVELSPRRIRKQWKAVLVVGFGEFILIAAVSFGVSLLLGFDLVAALFMAAALAASSTIVVVRHLKRTQRMFEPFGRLVTGVLLLQDALIITVIVVLVRLGGGAPAVVGGLAGMIALALVAYVFYRWIVPFVTLRFHLDDEETLLFALLLLFLFGGLSVWLQLPFIVGAFLAGFTLSAFPTNGLVRGLLASFSDFFLSVFFIALGMFITLPGPGVLAHAAVLSLAVIVFTVVGVAFLAERLGFNARYALFAGLLLTQTSEFSLILVLQGVNAGLLAPEVFSLIAVLTVTTMTLTPFLATDRVAAFLMRMHPRARRRDDHGSTPAGHILIIGLDFFGEHLIDPLRAAGHRVVVLDDDAVRVRQLCDRNIDCRQIETYEPMLLDRAGLSRARAVLCAPKHVEDIEPVLRHARTMGGPTPLVRVADEIEGKRVEALGGRPVVTAEHALDQLIDWIKPNIGAPAAD